MDYVLVAKVTCICIFAKVLSTLGTVGEEIVYFSFSFSFSWFAFNSKAQD